MLYESVAQDEKPQQPAPRLHTEGPIRSWRSLLQSKWILRFGTVFMLIISVIYFFYHLPQSLPSSNNAIDATKPDVDEPITEENDVNRPQISAETAAKTNSLTSICPNWSPAFAERYSEQCKFWLAKFSDWDASLTPSTKDVAYYCNDVTDCRGWGDRIGGIQNAFVKALNGKYAFKIGHDGLRDMFSPCLFQNKKANWAKFPRPFRPDNTACWSTRTAHCFAWTTMQCSGSAMVTVNTDRTCIPEGNCVGIRANLPESERLSVANVLGCSLRAMFEPSEHFLDKVTVPIKLGDGKREVKSIREIEFLLKKYYVISIHFRMGDGYAFFHKAGEFMIDSNEKFSRPFRCAQTLESYLINNRAIKDGEEVTVDDRPVRWFLASDSYRLKRQAIDKYGDKLITIDIKPEHVAMDTKTEDLTTTIAEWYILGLGDRLIVNKIGTTHGDFYHGRVSAFPKTTWAYQLKHMLYDAGTCREYPLPFEGIWEDIKTKSCWKNSYIAQGLKSFPQPHLQFLEKRNQSFPQAYVVNGNMIRLVNITADIVQVKAP